MALPQSHMNPSDNDGSNQPPLSAVTNTNKADTKIKILVIQQKMIGDVLASTIICESARRKYPKAQIDYVINENTKPVVLGNPYIDNIIEFKAEYKENKTAFFNFLKDIRRTGYDIVIAVSIPLRPIFFSSLRCRNTSFESSSGLINP